MRTFAFFCIVGGIGFGVDFLTFFLLSEWVNIHLARLLAFIVAVNSTFLLNSKVTFSQKNANYKLYLLGQTKGFIISFLIFELVLSTLSIPYTVYIAFVLGSGAGLLFNYFYAKFFVFKSESTNLNSHR